MMAGNTIVPKYPAAREVELIFTRSVCYQVWCLLRNLQFCGGVVLLPQSHSMFAPLASLDYDDR